MYVYIVRIKLCLSCSGIVFFQAEDGIRDLVRSRGLGDVYKRQQLVHKTEYNYVCVAEGLKRILP